MQEKRRVFLKKALVSSAAVAAGSVVGLNTLSAKTKQQEDSGVIYGKSNKKEILYKETKQWELYYKRSY
ncbi:MAG: Tat pathway signal protein [Campylobacteraceae bacterium]